MKKQKIDWWTLRNSCRWLLYPHGDSRCRYYDPGNKWPDKPCGYLRKNCPVWELLK